GVLVVWGGGGKISGLLGFFVTGLKNFKSGLKEGDGAGDAPKALDAEKSEAVETSKPDPAVKS
ncbi:MAG: twin-arginine translocase TatA/TatE family subunit, partial [Pseudomonadota bacterium]|nr:twin-arginine translocase TatA/TatE family subunit [Pseudomonadota bacterium]